MRVATVKYSDMKKLYPKAEVDKHLREKSLSTVTPINRGTGQRPDIFF